MDRATVAVLVQRATTELRRQFLAMRNSAAVTRTGAPCH
jgi:hypothetical protein